MLLKGAAGSPGNCEPDTLRSMRRVSPSADNGVTSQCVIEPFGNNLSANARYLASRVGNCFTLRKFEQAICEAAFFDR